MCDDENFLTLAIFLESQESAESAESYAAFNISVRRFVKSLVHTLRSLSAVIYIRPLNYAHVVKGNQTVSTYGFGHSEYQTACTKKSHHMSLSL